MPRRSETIAELLAWTPPKVVEVISHGLLHPETRMILYGSYGSWKTMLAMDLGFSIATGKNWLSYRTSTQPVLLAQTEIPKALFQKRAKKYVFGSGLNPPNLFVWTDLGLKLDTPYGLAALDAEVNLTNPRVLITDPLYRNMGGDISSSVDAQKLIDTIDQVAARYHLAVVMVAHPHKLQYDLEGNLIDRGSDKLMGSSYFADWADTIGWIKRDSTQENIIHLTWEKTRNAEDIVLPISASIDRATLQFSII